MRSPPILAVFATVDLPLKLHENLEDNVTAERPPGNAASAVVVNGAPSAAKVTTVGDAAPPHSRRGL